MKAGGLGTPSIQGVHPVFSFSSVEPFFISGQLPTRTIPHRTGIGPDEWFYSVVVVLVGSCPDGE